MWSWEKALSRHFCPQRPYPLGQPDRSGVGSQPSRVSPFVLTLWLARGDIFNYEWFLIWKTSKMCGLQGEYMFCICTEMHIKLVFSNTERRLKQKCRE